MLELLETTLLRANAAAAVVSVLLLLLRPAARRILGCEASYQLWSLPLVAALASGFPTASEFAGARLAPAILAAAQARLSWTGIAGLGSEPALVWAVGATLQATWIAFAHVRAVRAARAGRLGPAVIGVLWPRCVMPAGLEARFSPAEWRMIEAHERMHMSRGHPRDNLVLALALVVNWFNPLVHLAVRAARFDQELACDAAVLELKRYPARSYGAALLKAQPVRAGAAPAWRSESGRRLSVRIAALSLATSAVHRPRLMVAVLAGLGIAVGLQTWAMLPTLSG